MLCTGGCNSQSSDVANVVGQVTMNGEPVVEGNVVFENAEQGKVYLARIEGQGEYQLNGVKIGEYSVLLKPHVQNLPDETSGIDGNVIVAPKAVPHPTSIPARFQTAATSPLKAHVVEGDNQLSFDLAKSTAP